MIFAFLIGSFSNHANQNEHHQTQYPQFCTQLSAQRSLLAERYQSVNSDSSRQLLLDSAGVYLLQTIQTQLIPAWFGTPWDYNGISAVPGEGEIACGYFVSTVLKHAGLKLNRYKLAQQYSHSIVKSLSANENVHILRSGGPDAVANYLKTKPDGLYVIGLDFHVGFIEKDGDKLHFTHSNYLDRRGVEREPMLKSEALAASSLFVLGQVLPQPGLVKKWLLSESIAIVP